ncbi:MAG: hypothetical protein CSB55_00735 [Candidatus Cloacimonadota bacterium]|nr:MAG: hypothetical protein CSB55_00735 [Candidatus Cloacimonadota bacterium]
MSHRKLIFILILFFISVLNAEIRGIWVPVWDFDSPAEIDLLVENAYKWNFNRILAEVRYRADAMYFPNKNNSDFANPDPLNYNLPGYYFDPLEYLIKQAEKFDLEVIAWTTVLVATPHKTDLLGDDHVWFSHPEWFTCKVNGTKMSPKACEGAFLDPGVPEAREYIVDVLADIVSNYDIDGLQLDYIRYPGSQYGYNPVSLENYRREAGVPDENKWAKWKRDQVTELVKNIYVQCKQIKPEIEISASVIADIDNAFYKYSQNWTEWLQYGYIDRAYIMAYTRSDSRLKSQIERMAEYDFNKKVVWGLRAWTDSGSYDFSKIKSKINMARDYNPAGIALFYYSGMLRKRYQKYLPSVFPYKTLSPENREGKILYGNVISENGKPVSAGKIEVPETGYEYFIDSDGSFFINEPNLDKCSLKLFCNGKYYLFENIDLDKSVIRYDPVLNEKYAVDRNSYDYINLSSFFDEDSIVLRWKDDFTFPIKIFKKEKKRLSNNNSDFRKVEKIKKEKYFWADFDISPGKSYQYYIEDKKGRKSNIVTINQNEENQLIDVSLNRDPESEEFYFDFYLENSDQLYWCLMTLDGESLLSMKKKYLSGKNRETWNGDTVAGNKITEGVYKIYCFSEALMKEFTKTVILN